MPVGPVEEQTQATTAKRNYPACSALIARAMGGANQVTIDSREALERFCAAHPFLLVELPFLDDRGVAKLVKGLLDTPQII